MGDEKMTEKRECEFVVDYEFEKEIVFPTKIIVKKLVDGKQVDLKVYLGVD